ncbi:MAG TPA: TlpA disulfide reductase family protein [Candidatus Marinimicrobia bacterium]|jgi:peroxiredoxin|nr:TlpA disulfide reductase family protein [Candidatus Neomarinimicrobiota bacterium]MDP7216963.1 TlpA disulfide reductase family protein [Candidatus Neomarinimicrobiota bacterium]MDP7436821.1 TlpA disulfide reductase family protein [Candidatus Neomarinimicrobiota bacterium]HJL75314.1 TlpA disulfide reductase family protein [Candidatus Neomarinimicrobiota bacterium]HJM70647.1 TlpA disulfide reductase family protein [Candidatus Neomarinimicrobiota bacterium]|tara:strand:+ start:4595 stop:5161 length:567 start_codon:yes stop_codon:yes gene_type:complete
MKNNLAIFNILLLISCGSTESSGGENSVVVNKILSQPQLPANAVSAPEFTLATTSGDLIKMSDMKGKVVLLTFWGTWCGPCRAEIPEFKNLHNKYNKDGLEIVGITLTSGPPQRIQSFADQWKIEYLLLTDISANETQIALRDYGNATNSPITGIPTTFLIDRNGYIVKRYLGPRSEKIFYNDIEPYL